jgi:hypothetical protein
LVLPEESETVYDDGVVVRHDRDGHLEVDPFGDHLSNAPLETAAGPTSILTVVSTNDEEPV